MVLGLRTVIRFWLGVFWLGAVGWSSPSLGAVHHTDKIPISELAHPKHHHQCLPIVLPAWQHPHRLISETGTPRSYQVLVHRATDQGLPQLVMAYHQGFESWVLSAVPSQEVRVLQALSQGQQPRGIGPTRLSPEVTSFLSLIKAARQARAQALRDLQQAEGKLIRHLNFSPSMPAELKSLLKEAPLSQREAQLQWLRHQGSLEGDALLRTYDVAKEQWQTQSHQIDALLIKARDQGVTELFQAFDPAYHVPPEADTVLVWFPGMGTGVSQVLTVKTVVYQTLGLMKGTSREGKIWPVGVSLPKHGGPENVQTLDDMMAWMDRVVSYYRYMGKKVILAGRSASGSLILEYASRYPEKLAGVLPFGHVWPERAVQIDANRDYLIHGPDEELRQIAYPHLIDWTIELLTACSWHRRMKDPTLRDHLPPIFMAHGWADDEYKARQPDGSWKSILPEVVRTFSTWAANIPAIRYLVFEKGWHNLFLVHDANQARGRAYQALKLFLQAPDQFEPQQLKLQEEYFDPLHIHP